MQHLCEVPLYITFIKCALIVWIFTAPAIMASQFDDDVSRHFFNICQNNRWPNNALQLTIVKTSDGSSTSTNEREVCHTSGCHGSSYLVCQYESGLGERPETFHLNLHLTRQESQSWWGHTHPQLSSSIQVLISACIMLSSYTTASQKA